MAGVVVTADKIAEAKALYASHFGNATVFNEEGLASSIASQQIIERPFMQAGRTF